MKLQHLADIPKTMAHDNLLRQRFIAPGDLKSKVQTVNYVEMEPGDSYTPHTHPDCEEFSYVIEGEVEAIVAGKTFTLKAGDFLVVEVGEEHQFTNKSKGIFKYFGFRVMI